MSRETAYNKYLPENVWNSCSFQVRLKVLIWMILFLSLIDITIDQRNNSHRSFPPCDKTKNP
jgi:hypothetical protein